MVGEMFYGLAFKGLQFGIQVYRGDTHAQVWTRNSYRLGNWVPFVSDIDVSVWMAHPPSSRDLARFKSAYSRMKKLFPVIGNVNLYIATEKHWTEQLINRFELERDPQLAKKLSPRSPIKPEVQAAAFLLRMVEKDIDSILAHPEAMKAKWNAHIRRMAQVIPKAKVDVWKGFPERTLLRGILDSVADLLDLPEGEQKDFAEPMELYFQSLGRKVPLDLLRPLASKNAAYCAGLPHRFCFETESHPALGDSYVSLARAQISWEILRMLTRRRFWKQSEPEKAVIRAHLKSLEEFYSSSIEKNSSLPEFDLVVREIFKQLGLDI